jgi:hypothetical protein
MELYIWLSITLSANILIFNFSCFFKQLPPFLCRFNFCITPLLQEVQAPVLKFIWKKQFSIFFWLPRLYLTLATIKTSEFSTLGRCILKRVRFRWKIYVTPLSSLLSDSLVATSAADSPEVFRLLSDWYTIDNRQTSGESASLPQYLGCNTVFDMRLRFTFLRRKTVSLQSNIAHANKF